MNVKEKVSLIVEALESKTRVRLGKVKKACRKVLSDIPRFDNPTGRKVIKEMVDRSEDARELSSWALYNIYFGAEIKVNPASKVYTDIAYALGDLTDAKYSFSMRGVALFALGNLGPAAVKLAYNKHKLNFIAAEGSKSPFLKRAVQFAMDQYRVQEGGAPLLGSTEVQRIRAQFGNDIPAFQESVHYDFTIDGDDLIPGYQKKGKNGKKAEAEKIQIHLPSSLKSKIDLGEGKGGDKS